MNPIGRIIRVLPAEKYFPITWQLTTRCNYDCMYCSPMWHDDRSGHHGLEIMQQAWKNIFERTSWQNLKYKIAFTGGELTTNKFFLPFVSWLRSEYNQHLFKLLTTTNGSATYKYYLKSFQVLDNITFSVHSEHMDENKFFDMVIQLKKTIPKDRFIQVAIMDEFWNQDRIPKYIELLEKHQVSYTVNKIDYSHQTRLTPIFKGNLNLGV